MFRPRDRCYRLPMRTIAPLAAVTLLLVAAGCGDTGARDAGAEEADATSGLDARPACERNADCDDGVYCNGVKRCVGAVCEAGTNPCAIDEQCEESAGRCVLVSCAGGMADRDGDGSASLACGGDDCDDADGNRRPGKAEVCDVEGHDEDCDPTTFGVRDLDGDGEPDAACCNGAVCGSDCDDTRAGVNPLVPEVCGNGVDDDCDGRTDEGGLTDGFVDADGDGWGDSAMPLSACPGAPGFSANGGDCEDDEPTVNPGMSESCNERDDDCDGATDEDLTVVTCFRDSDRDGYGVSVGSTTTCGCTDGWATASGDCNDMAGQAHPGETAFLSGSHERYLLDGTLVLSMDWSCDGTLEPQPRSCTGLCAGEGPTVTEASCGAFVDHSRCQLVGGLCQRVSVGTMAVRCR